MLPECEDALRVHLSEMKSFKTELISFDVYGDENVFLGRSENIYFGYEKQALKKIVKIQSKKERRKRNENTLHF